MTLEERLRAGATAEDLAAEFTQELNSAIAAINREKAIQDDAQLTADSWNHFVQSYFAVHKIPDGATLDDFKISSTTIIDLLNNAKTSFEYIDKYAKQLDSVLKATKDLGKSFKIDKPTRETTKPLNTSSFEDTMRDFFKALHIDF